jgi:hypothetical protein
MPIELRGTIELKDITAVEFRCQKCGYATILPLKDDDSFRVPKCSDCESHMQQDHSANSQAVTKFFRELAVFAAKERPYSIRLHVDGLDQVRRAARPEPPALSKVA